MGNYNKEGIGMDDYDDFHDGLVEVGKCDCCGESFSDCECCENEESDD
jgi:hypothetical protein